MRKGKRSEGVFADGLQRGSLPERCAGVGIGGGGCCVWVCVCVWGGGGGCRPLRTALHTICINVSKTVSINRVIDTWRPVS